MKTPQLPAPKLAQAIGLNAELYLKREDMHHFGSHKGRSIPRMIDLYRKEGIQNFVISSSGNAALAAIFAVQAHNENSDRAPLTLKVFIGKKIPPEKLNVLRAVTRDRHISLEQVENPKQMAFQIDKDKKARNLRQSTDDTALLGYQELAEELNHIPNLSAIFIPTSSGTTAQALGESFRTLSQHPEIHIVQTTSCHPIADAFIKTEELIRATLSPRERAGVRGGSAGEGWGEGSLASAIVDHIAHRKRNVLDVVKNSGGSGWIATDPEIKGVMELAEDTENLIISSNSALSIVGLSQAVRNGWKPKGAVVCLITGR